MKSGSRGWSPGAGRAALLLEAGIHSLPLPGSAGGRCSSACGGSCPGSASGGSFACSSSDYVISFCFSCKDTRDHIRANLGNPGSPSHLQILNSITSVEILFPNKVTWIGSRLGCGRPLGQSFLSPPQFFPFELPAPCSMVLQSWALQLKS